MGRQLDTTQATAGLTEHDAERIAYEEMHDTHRERGVVVDPGVFISAHIGGRGAHRTS